ncbi:MAG: metallophosphoesterase [Lentisphaeria bacterium]|nr:metallophosphoesterase [Lentisphaeria bacterium]
MIIALRRSLSSMCLAALLGLSLVPVVVVAQTAEAPPSTAVPEFAVPAWVDQQISETKARFDAWRGDDEVVVFPLVTDIHAARPFFTNPPNLRDTKYHVLFAQRAALACNADFFAELGDIGFDRDLKWQPSKKADAELRLEAQRNLFKDFALPVLFCMGNHDSGRAFGGVFSELRLTQDEYGAMFNGMTKKKGVPLVTSPGEDYGYYDVPGKKCRVFFLNTSDQHEVGVTPTQMQFLADNLRLPPGTCVVLLSHATIHPTLGKRDGQKPRSIANGSIGLQLLTAFRKGEKGSAGDVHWDFTANQDCSLAGWISGHNHFNDHREHEGIPFILSQGYGTKHLKDLPTGVDYVTPVDRTKTMLVDMVAIKPAKRDMMIFRIGAGGPERDRAFKF